MEQATVGERVVLDTRVLHPFEIGARLEALLCYSKWSAERREKIADAICARLFAFTIAQDPTLKRELSRKYPRYAKHNRTNWFRWMAGARKCFGLAAFLPMLKEPATGELPELYGEKRKLTLEQIVRFIWPVRPGGPNFVYEDWLKDREKDVRADRPTRGRPVVPDTLTWADTLPFCFARTMTALSLPV
jgi:hypothetical protein